MISEIQAYWDRVPCGSRHGQSAVGSYEWSQEVTLQRYFVQPHILGFAEFWSWRGKRVLEIGGGLGTDTLQFARQGAIVTMIEFSPVSLALAAKRFKEEELDATFICADAEKPLPLSAAGWNTFDLSYSFGVLHHTPQPGAVLQNMKLYLKPDRELRIMLYAKWSIKHLTGEQPEAQAGCPLVRWYSKREATKLLEASGFRVVSIRKTHIFPWRVSDYVEHRYVKRWVYRWMPGWFFRCLERIAGHHLLVVAVKA